MSQPRQQRARSNEPRVVSPQEAQDWLDRGAIFPSDARLILPTIATEPDRIRAAVVDALRQESFRLRDQGWISAAENVDSSADAIIDGAPL